ncbi:DoxX family protein [Salmonirosea aquatica]|uniref:DoxX family protein n=1 Tax=Salmonirosea aquatica TaxID=2654236 RepID=A0A7C9G009_9BACT|nr:DoxX family protein [Cytophagaceae bacterium SJW1-29]
MIVYLMGLLYMTAGIAHLVSPRFFLKIVPPYLPFPDVLVLLSGIAEIVLGTLLFFPTIRPWAAWGIIILLIAVFPANLYMAYGAPFQALSAWLRWGRLPLQLVLIWWAYQYTK